MRGEKSNTNKEHKKKSTRKRVQEREYKKKRSSFASKELTGNKYRKLCYVY